MFFVVMGASGAGKSAALSGLQVLHPQIVWYDFDALGVPADADKKWRQRTTEQWLKIASEHQAQGQDVGLCGGAIFGEILACPSAPLVTGIAGCLLDCNDVVRIDRLRGRNAHDDGISQDMLCWAAWQRMHAVDPQWRQDVIREDAEPSMQWQRWEQWQRGDARWQIWTFDTTHVLINEVVKSLSAWALQEKQQCIASHGSLQGQWWNG